MTTGINQRDGTLLSDEAHLRQSITDILTTPLGSRVLRRDYGSRLYELIDAPISRQTVSDPTTPLFPESNLSAMIVSPTDRENIHEVRTMA